MPAAVYAGILVLSSIPGDQFPDTGLPGWVSYVAHAVEYGVLGASLRWALGRIPRPVVVVLIAASLLGAIDEAYQSTVPGREPSAIDWLVDVGAGTIGAILAGRASPGQDRSSH